MQSISEWDENRIMGVISKGYIGPLCEHARLDDLAFVLFGCSVLVILRKS